MLGDVEIKINDYTCCIKNKARVLVSYDMSLEYKKDENNGILLGEKVGLWIQKIWMILVENFNG